MVRTGDHDSPYYQKFEEDPYKYEKEDSLRCEAKESNPWRNLPTLVGSTVHIADKGYMHAES